MTPDHSLLEHVVSHLAAMDRGSASEGERAAAEWLAEELRERGCRVAIEEERAHGGYWWPLGLLTGGAGLAGLAALRGGRRRRALAALVGAGAAAGIADDIGGGRHWFRRGLGHRPTWNVVAEAGDPDAERTLVLVAHHDAAHSGIVFHPGIPDFAARWFPGLLETSNTSPPLMWTVVRRPGARRARRADRPARRAACGDARVAGLRGGLCGHRARARRARRQRQPRPASPRSWASPTSSRASRSRACACCSSPPAPRSRFMEGMRAFAARHFGRLPRESTHVVASTRSARPT